MAKEAKNRQAELRVGDLSEILVLSILCKLGSAEVPQIVAYLRLVTKTGKTPFYVGSSIGQVLKWRERLNEVQEEERNHATTYKITDEGKKTVEQYGSLMLRLFPNLSKVKRGQQAMTAG